MSYEWLVTGEGDPFSANSANIRENRGARIGNKAASLLPPDELERFYRDIEDLLARRVRRAKEQIEQGIEEIGATKKKRN